MSTKFIITKQTSQQTFLNDFWIRNSCLDFLSILSKILIANNASASRKISKQHSKIEDNLINKIQYKLSLTDSFYSGNSSILNRIRSNDWTIEILTFYWRWCFEINMDFRYNILAKFWSVHFRFEREID